MSCLRAVRFAFIAFGLILGQLPIEADAQTANVTITAHVMPNPKVYQAQVPSGATVEKAMQQAKIQYNATWYPSVGGYALMILEGTPSTTNGAFGSPFWWLCIDDVSPNLGMSAQPVKDGDHIDWYFVSDGKCPKDTASKPH